jgi:UDPglucose 6-dehydrogenase
MTYVCIHGEGHLADTLRAAARRRGFDLGELFGFVGCLTFAVEDVRDHADLAGAHACFDAAVRGRSAPDVPVVLVSQVPPGTTREWAAGRPNVFYQVDTVIVNRAVARAYAPEQFIVGCSDPSAPLPLAYQEYLAVHDCPVLQMSYESAEVAKLAINYVLSKQIEAACDLAAVSAAVGADYADVERALRNDARIGPHAYLRPGRTNQHLQRDVDTVCKLLQGEPGQGRARHG